MTTRSSKPDEDKPEVRKMVDREEAAPLTGDTPPTDATKSDRKVVGGAIYEGGRLIGYTDEGATSATQGGIPDPTVQPGTGTVTDPMPDAAEAAEEKK